MAVRELSGEAPYNEFSKCLTWSELVHMSYFNVPEFRKLVAYVIANSDGFGPSIVFRNEPDYETVAHWYEEIQPKNVSGNALVAAAGAR